MAYSKKATPGVLASEVKAARDMPIKQHNAIAQWMQNLSEEIAPEPIHAAYIKAIEEGLADIERGDFVPEEELKAVFDRFRR